MKRFWPFLTLAATILILAPFVLSGCGKLGGGGSDRPEARVTVQGAVTRNGEAHEAQILVVPIDGGEDVWVSTLPDGTFHVELSSQPSAIVAVANGLFAELVSPSFEYEVILELVDIPSYASQALPQGLLGEYWWGVYDTDGHGDVRFRYRYNFSRYYCASWLPGWPIGDPNPNHWGGWDLTDFPPPWKGKKLLVPTRYQIWHRAAYGYSISQALYLVSWS